MAKPLIHFPMDEDELLLAIEALRYEIAELKCEEGSSLHRHRQQLTLLQIRLSATYKELSDMTCSKN